MGNQSGSAPLTSSQISPALAFVTRAASRPAAKAIGTTELMIRWAFTESQPEVCRIQYVSISHLQSDSGRLRLRTTACRRRHKRPSDKADRLDATSLRALGGSASLWW